MKNEEILGLSFYSQDLQKDITIKDYLKTLLKQLIRGCSFEYSNWIDDLYVSLVKYGLVQGKISVDGAIDEVDSISADKILKNLIDTM